MVGIIIIVFSFIYLLIMTGLAASGITGEGKLRKDRGLNKLETDEIYEVIISAPYYAADNPLLPNYIVILKNRKGELQAFMLDRNPPKIFKKTTDGVYRSYP